MQKPSDNTQWVGYVDELYFKGNQARWMYMTQWLQNYHFYVGNQWIRFNKRGDYGSWEALPELDGRIQYVSNKILPATKMAVGRMIKDDMKQIVIHANQDEKSIDAAKAATRFLDYLWRETHGDFIRKELCTWSVLAGMGICKYYVDLDKGPSRKDMKAKDGDICVDIVSPFEFVVPANARYMDKLPWAMHARMETKEYVYEKWDVEVEATGNANEWAMYQAVNINITQDGAFFGADTRFQDDLVLVKELWIRPCKNYPKGKVIIVAGTQVVHNDDIPHDKDWWPFNWLSYGDVPFRFWPMSMIESMVDPQKAINNMSSNILSNIQYMGNPIVSAPQGSVDPDSMVAEPGAVWEYNPAGGKPEFVTMNPVPPAIFSEKSQLESEIYDLAGIHMLGSGMSGLRAAAAIMLVEQQDETAFAPIIANVQSFMKRDAHMKLWLAQKSFTTKRKVKVLGEEGQWQVEEFNAADLCGDEDIDIQTKQDMANDKSTRFNQVLQIISTKNPDNPTEMLIDKHTALQLLDIAGLESAVTDYDLDVNRAKDENQKMKDGEQVAVNDFDDHAAHIRIHNQERKRIDFDQLSKKVRDEFAIHVQQHQQMLQAQSPAQTEAKGDEQVGQPQPGMQQPMQPQNPIAQGMPMVGGYNSGMALQRGIDATHNLIAQGGR